MVFFVAPTCPICKSLIPTVKAFAHSERLNLPFVGNGDLDENRQMAERHSLAPDRFVYAPEAGRALQVAKLPYAVLVNELGMRSVQEYLAKHAPSSARALPGPGSRRIGARPNPVGRRRRYVPRPGLASPQIAAPGGRLTLPRKLTYAGLQLDL